MSVLSTKKLFLGLFTWFLLVEEWNAWSYRKVYLIKQLSFGNKKHWRKEVTVLLLFERHPSFPKTRSHILLPESALLIKSLKCSASQGYVPSKIGNINIIGWSDYQRALLLHPYSLQTSFLHVQLVKDLHLPKYLLLCNCCRYRRVSAPASSRLGY